MSFLFPPFIGLLSYCLSSHSASDENMHIFRAGRVYEYQAVFISPKGDTLSREQITLTPTGQPWKYQKKVQTAIAVRYHYTKRDSLTFLAYSNPTTKKKEEPKRYIWAKSITTGAIENKQEVWMHPFRDNQYNYTEIAPYPEVKLDSLAIGSVWHSKYAILMGWGAFNGKTTCQYQVMRQEAKRYGQLSLSDCWLVQATAQHTQLGTSYLDFYFHPTYGFLEMNYRFYDGAKISFTLKQVTDK